MGYAASIHTPETLFNFGFDILFNNFSSLIYVLAVILVLHNCKPIWDLNLIRFPNLQLT
jgi:hypothetical protein